MNILLLGGNGFGFAHAESYQRLGLDFSVFSRNENVLKEYEVKFGVKKAFSNLENALNWDYDIIDIVMPHNLHKDIAVYALKHGKNVLVEKPIATTLEEAKTMIDEAQKNNVKLMVAEQYYFDRSLQFAIKSVSEGKIGKVHTIITRGQRYFHEAGWRTKEKEMGGGALIDGGIHYLEAFLNMGGEYGSIYSMKYKGNCNIQGEDTSSALFSFKSGAKGIFFYSWAYKFAPALPAYEIIGTDGSIYDSNVRSKHVRTAFGKPVLNGHIQDIDEVDVIDQEIYGFVKSVENDEPVPYPLDNAIRNLKAVISIYA
jgi:predicted dehydrogenase